MSLASAVPLPMLILELFEQCAFLMLFNLMLFKF